MSSHLRRIERRIRERINNADPERPLYRLCQRGIIRKNGQRLTHRQAQRGVRN